MTTRRLKIALGVLGLLALAGLPIQSAELRFVLWVFLAGLGLKTYLAWVKERMDSDETRRGPRGYDDREED